MIAERKTAHTGPVEGRDLHRGLYDPAWIRGAGLGIYTALMMFLLTALFIPAGPLTNAVIHRLSRQGVQVEVGRARRIYPLGLSWENVQIHAPGEWRVDRASARVEFLSLLRLNPAVRWSVRLASGLAEGRLWESGDGYGVEGRGEGIALERLAPAADDQRTVRGTAEFTVKGSWGKRDPKGNAGSLNLTLTTVGIPAWTTRAGSLPELHFDTAAAKIDLAGAIGTIREFEAIGREVDVSTEGSCLLRTPIGSSLLNLMVHLTPKPGGPREGLLALIDPQGKGGGDMVSVKGTLGEPTIAVGGVSMGNLF